ncbi:MAG: molybdopterin dehydrogenase, FAD-binding protein [Solirubrobacterales bacterium]|nr:molybdopterin dehydrogenase, FAD-binding protein [Solirubrobacterales bacterium]
MKPASFEYHRADTVEDAIDRLARIGPGAKLLAGGQSLVPMMNFRLARPEALIDITRIASLRHVTCDGRTLRIGALATHRAIEDLDGELPPEFALLPRAARLIAHAPIRSRGTFGGSIAHADPAAEWCLLAVALDAVITARGPHGARDIPADQFFRGFLETALEPGEIIVEVRFDHGRRHAALVERARRHADFAIVAVAVALRFEGGRCAEARVVLGGVDEVPVRVVDAERALTGQVVSEEACREAGAIAAAVIDPVSDVHADAEHRRELASVLVARALAQAVQAADPMPPGAPVQKEGPA